MGSDRWIGLHGGDTEEGQRRGPGRGKGNRVWEGPGRDQEGGREGVRKRPGRRSQEVRRGEGERAGYWQRAVLRAARCPPARKALSERPVSWELGSAAAPLPLPLPHTAPSTGHVISQAGVSGTTESAIYRSCRGGLEAKNNIVVM